MKTELVFSPAQLEQAEITQADVRHDAAKPYLAVIVQCDETEFRRNFEPDANDDRILEDFCKDYRHWRIV